MNWSIRVPDANAARTWLSGGARLSAVLDACAASIPASLYAPLDDLRTALETMRCADEQVSRIYYGPEFCELRLPAASALEEVLDLAERHHLAFTLLTPPVTDAGIAGIQPLLETLTRRGLPLTEVLASDWGVLRVIKSRHPGLRAVLGRLLHPGVSDPRLGAKIARCPDLPESARRFFQGTSTSARDYLAVLAAFGVRRVEFDRPHQGLATGLAESGVAGSVHLPYGVVATGRVCYPGSLDRTRSEKFALFPCARQCGEVWFDRDANPRWIESGNTSFFTLDREAMLRTLVEAREQGIDRCVLDLGLPHGGPARSSDRPKRGRQRAVESAPDSSALGEKPGERRDGAVRIRVAAPLGSADEVEMLVGAGAGELYAGLVPPGWIEKLSGANWPNRRMPGRGNLSSYEDLTDATRRSHDLGVPLALTLNAPAYDKAAIAEALELAYRAAEIGVDALIVADPGLLHALHVRGPAVSLRVSSVAAVHNVEAARFFTSFGVDRIILPRHVSLAEVRDLCAALPEVSFEAFVLNDQCPFEEGHCFTRHGLGGLPVFCQDPAPRRVIDALRGEPLVGPELTAWNQHDRHHREWLDACSGYGGAPGKHGVPRGACGLCALPALLAAGVRTVKVVGREASAHRKFRSVQIVRRILNQVEAAAGRGDVAPTEVMAVARGLRGAPASCEGGYDCYYREVRPR